MFVIGLASLVLLGVLNHRLQFFEDEDVLKKYARLDSLERGLITLKLPDTTFFPNDQCPQSKYLWIWDDQFNGRKNKLLYNVCSQELSQAEQLRSNIVSWNISEVYLGLIKNDSTGLRSLIRAIKATCRERQYDYLQSIGFTVSMIQHIPYTLILSTHAEHRCPCEMEWGVTYLDDCIVRQDGRGCCNDVNQFGLFSPIEFAVNKTGDCDTRTVFAYTVLTSLGFDVTILNSESHSILGVYSPKDIGLGDFVRGKNNRKYYCVELTTKYEMGKCPPSINVSKFQSVIK